MKRLIVVFGLLLLMLPAVGISHADDSTVGFNGSTKAEAIIYIEKSLSDPQISEWVLQKFHSKDLFLKAVKLAPENAVKSIAVNFSDFQKIGGGDQRNGCDRHRSNSVPFGLRIISRYRFSSLGQ